MSARVEARARVHVVLEVTLENSPDSGESITNLRAEVAETATFLLQRAISSIGNVKMIGDPVVQAVTVEVR